MSKGQNYRTSVDVKLSLELLNVAPRATKDGGVEEPLGIRLRIAVKHLEEVVQEANEYLEDSELAQKLAEALATEKNKRGFPAISVDAQGNVMLDVDYTGKKQQQGKKRRKYKKGLPLLVDLRKEANALGVDVSHLGQKRRAVFDFLEEVKARRAPVDSFEDAEPAQMAAGVDETTVEPARDAPKPPKLRPKVRLTIPGKTLPNAEDEAPAEAKASPNLTAILEAAPADVDIDDLLGDGVS